MGGAGAGGVSGMLLFICDFRFFENSRKDACCPIHYATAARFLTPRREKALAGG